LQAASLEDEPGPDRWRPWLLGGLCLLFVLRPLFPSESAAQGDGLVVVMLWIALAVLWLLGAVGRGQFRVRFGWVDAAVVLLVAWHSVAAVWATTRASPRPAVNMLWEWIAYALCFLLARQLIVGRREARAIVAVMVGLAVALAGYGIYQYFWEMPTTLRDYFNDPDGALREAGLWFEAGSRQRDLFRSRLGTFRPIATFALTNSLAGYLAPWLVITAGIGASAGLSRKRWRTWLAAAACALSVATCLFLTGSRTGCVAAILGLSLLAMAWRKERTGRIGWKLPVGIAALGAILLAGVLVAGGRDGDVLSLASKSLGYRVQYWRSTLEMIADHPVVGCGPGNFQDTYTRYMLPEASEEIADPHNFLMEVWATAGTPALVALLAVLSCLAVAFAHDRWRLHAEPSPYARGSGSEVDATPHVIGGALAGFLLSILVGQMGTAPPGIVVVILGLPLAAVAVALLWPWIDDGPMSPVVPAIGVVVVLTNLLAAGAMGFPGVGGTLWLLAALSLNLAETSRPRTHPRMVALAGLGVMMALALTCSSSAFKPVLTSQAAMRLAEEDERNAVEHLKAAAVADPLSADPWRQLAGHAFNRWLQRPSPQALDDFETAMKTALELAPNSASTWRMLGET